MAGDGVVAKCYASRTSVSAPGYLSCKALAALRSVAASRAAGINESHPSGITSIRHVDGGPRRKDRVPLRGVQLYGRCVKEQWVTDYPL